MGIKICHFLKFSQELTWLLSDTPDGGKASSLHHRLGVTAKLNGVNAYKGPAKFSHRNAFYKKL